jgi:membrane-bound lytic murein transglycosylase B
VRAAQRLYSRNRPLLAKVSLKYGVSSKIITAVWGLESNFGRFSGVRPTIPALVTLAYDARRSLLFREELFSALEILNRGDIDLEKLKGSWAGALGQPQFMPSKYLQFAQDFDGDGKRDIWTSLPDVFASIAYFLQQHGWAAGQTWGREVKATRAARDAVAALPRREEGCRAERVMTEPQPLEGWRKLGLRTMSGAALPRAKVNASVVEAGSRTFLVYGNYEALLGYNCAHSYTLAVGLLSDRIR